MLHTIRRSDKLVKSVVEAALKKNDEKSPSKSAVSSGYSSVSSIPSFHEADDNNSTDDNGGTDEHTTSGVRRKTSVVLMPETGNENELNGESHDFDDIQDAHTRGSGGIPAFDAFGESKRRDAKSYNIEQKFLKVCRFIMYVVIFCTVLGGGVLTKLSLLSLTSSYKQSEGSDRTRYAVYLVTLMCVYPCFTLLSSLFKVLFGKVKSLSKRFIAFLMMIEVLRTFGLLLFLFKVIPNITGIGTIYLTMSVPVVPALLTLVNTIRCSKRILRKRILVSITIYVVMFVIQAGGLLVFHYLGVSKDVTENEIVWIAPTSVVLISLGWWENFVDLKRTKFSTLQQFQSDMRKSRTKAQLFTMSTRLLTVGVFVLLVVYQPSSYFDVSNSSNKDLTEKCSTSRPVQNNSIYNNETRGNATENNCFSVCMFRRAKGSIKDVSCTDVLYCSARCVTYLSSDTSTDSSRSWFETLSEYVKGFVIEHALVLQIIALTFVVSYCSTLACKLKMQIIGFSLPAILISPLFLTYTLLKCGNQLPFDVISLEVTYLCPSWQLTSAVHITLAILLWISIIVLTIYVWFPNSQRMAKLESIFLPELKDCIFVDFNLLLKYKRGSVSKHFSRTEREKVERVVPKVYICATMWHENWKEMVQLIKSLLRIDRHCAVSKAAEMKFSITTEDPDKFEPEIHIIFDDAFTIDEDSNQRIPNKYVQQFMACLDEAASDILGSEVMNEWNSSPLKSTLPYGGRLTWTLPGKTKMVVHLKNKLKIRHRKRWSQVMYLYYLLGFETFHFKTKDEVIHERKYTGGENDGDINVPRSFRNILPDQYKTKLENTFIFTLDGDVDFEPKSVLLLIDRMKKNTKVGAVCGRIHPIGSGPLVWYQKFEYAVGHWLQKAAEHVLGCVLCCPGCFSLFRASALIDDNVVKTYTKKPTEALHYIQFEQGEDRWLCTLLLQQGYKIDYCAGADAYTYAPETFNEFFIQRRRWSPSTNANIIDLLKSWNHTVQQNANISRLFMAYQGLMLATSLLAPATVTLMVTGSYSSVLGFDSWTSYILSITPIIFFIVVCLKCKQEIQLMFAAILSSIYTIVMIVVTVGTILNIAKEQILSPNVLFLIGLAVIFTLSALWHPKEFSCLLHGLLYYVAVPSTFIFLTIYYICNLNIVTWGTREDKQTNVEKKHVKKKETVSLRSALKFVLKKTSRSKTSKQHVQDEKDDNDDDEILNEISVEKPNPMEESKDTLSENDTDWMNLEPFKKYKTERESKAEEQFWNKLLRKYLLPIEGNKQHEAKIKSDLMSLRNNVVFAFFMINFMFSIALLQLQVNRDKLIKFYIYGKYEPVSVIFLSLFSVLLVLQFLSMIIHRWGTFQHLISSTHIFSCRQLSNKEKFAINFQEANEHIDQPETPFDSAPEADHQHGIYTVNTDEIENHERQIERSLYERRFNTNFAKSMKFKSRSRQRVQDVNWNARKLTLTRNLRKEYVAKLYQSSDVY